MGVVTSKHTATKTYRGSPVKWTWPCLPPTLTKSDLGKGHHLSLANLQGEPLIWINENIAPLQDDISRHIQIRAIRGAVKNDHPHSRLQHLRVKGRIEEAD